MALTQGSLIYLIFHSYFPASTDIFNRIGIYKRLFAKWEFRKNNRGKDWIWVNHRIEKRAALGKKSSVLRKGNLQDRNTVRKEIARHVTTYEEVQAAGSEPPISPVIFDS